MAGPAKLLIWISGGGHISMEGQIFQQMLLLPFSGRPVLSFTVPMHYRTVSDSQGCLIHACLATLFRTSRNLRWRSTGPLAVESDMA